MLEKIADLLNSTSNSVLLISNKQGTKLSGCSFSFLVGTVCTFMREESLLCNTAAYRNFKWTVCPIQQQYSDLSVDVPFRSL